MSGLLKRIAIFTIFIGIIGISIRFALGENTMTLLSKEQTNGITYYKLDIWEYYLNINSGLGQINKLIINKPTREWNSDIVNDLAVIVNVLIFAINILLYPFRIGAYIIHSLITFMGINTTTAEGNGLYWLVELIQFLIGKAQLPYI